LVKFRQILDIKKMIKKNYNNFFSKENFKKLLPMDDRQFG